MLLCALSSAPKTVASGDRERHGRRADVFMFSEPQVHDPDLRLSDRKSYPCDVRFSRKNDNKSEGAKAARRRGLMDRLAKAQEQALIQRRAMQAQLNPPPPPDSSGQGPVGDREPRSPAPSAPPTRESKALPDK